MKLLQDDRLDNNLGIHKMLKFINIKFILKVYRYKHFFRIISVTVILGLISPKIECSAENGKLFLFIE